ncbi:MAG: beta-lactamase family protein [Oligoflexia bacterium]|nr:beta-lactamase family protein [Oligoflexia bacterium]
MKFRLPLIVFFLLCLLTSSCNSEKEIKPLDEYLNHLTKYDKALGTVLLRQKGKTIYHKSYGTIKRENDTIYHIGSITKTFTATIIIKLIEEGKFQFNTTLDNFYPTIKNAKLIQIKHLLQHRSGLVNYTDQQTEYNQYRFRKTTEKELIKLFEGYGTEFIPGTKFKYSNTGYALLTFIAQKVTGKSYSDLLSKYITEPLKLKDTFVYDLENPREREVPGYFKEHSWSKSKMTHQSVPLGAGAIASTTTDLATFIEALLKGRLVHPKSLDIMMVMKDGFGFGLIQVPFNKDRGYGHTGGLDGYRSIAFYFPKHDLTVINLVNGLDTVMNDISIAILKSFHGIDFKLPIFPKYIQVKEELLKQYAGTYKAKNIPLSINFFIDNKNLFGQVLNSGQERFPLNAVSGDEFEFSLVGVLIKFYPKESKIVFKQNGATYEMFRVK